MLLQEIPALPFNLDLPSAVEWLETLPLANIRECCQRFLPVLQALNVYPMPLQLRFDILEHCHPVVQCMANGLAPHFMGARFPLEDKSRKVASLPARFHLEAGLGYRQLVEAAEFAESFSQGERTLIYWRALEHLLHSMLRAAQVYDPPSSSVRSSLRKLYRCAEAQGVLDTLSRPEGKPPATLRELFIRALLFGLAVPRSLPQTDMQRLFDFLAERESEGQSLDENSLRSLFVFDPHDLDLLVPLSPALPPPEELRWISAERLLPTLRLAAHSETDPLRRVLPRLGDRLPCLDQTGSRRVAACTGFKAIVPMLKDVEFRKAKSGRRGEAWPALNELELAPLDSTRPITERPRFTERTLAETVAAAETSDKPRMAEVVPTELPGFYLLDSGRWLLRTGLLVGLNSDDEWIQVGVVRSGQIRDGRFWHSFELLGAKPQLVRARSERAKDGTRNALWLEGSELDGGWASLLIEPGKWRSGDIIAVEAMAGRYLVRIAKMLEATNTFHRYAVIKLEPANAAPPG